MVKNFSLDHNNYNDNKYINISIYSSDVESAALILMVRNRSEKSGLFPRQPGSIPGRSVSIFNLKMKFKFNYQGKGVELDVKECRNVFSKVCGLMFRKKSPCLLFYFGKPERYRIHSFFCKPFAAIWFDGGKIVDMKVIKSWRFFIRPVKKFDKLLEIPSNDAAFKEFLDGNRKI